MAAGVILGNFNEMVCWVDENEKVYGEKGTYFYFNDYNMHRQFLVKVGIYVKEKKKNANDISYRVYYNNF